MRRRHGSAAIGLIAAGLLLAGCRSQPGASASAHPSVGGQLPADAAPGPESRDAAAAAGDNGHAGSAGTPAAHDVAGSDSGSAGRADDHSPWGAGANAGIDGGVGSMGSAGVSDSGAASDSGGASHAGSAGDSGSGDSAGITPMTCAPADAVGACGNGVLDPGESCDGADLRGLSCSAVDPFFTAGTLGCATNCTLNTGLCVHGTCGNGVLDPGEDCEPGSFTERPCSDLLPSSDNALVECSATCHYDLSNCSGAPAPVCGNGIREAGEQCDGEDRFARSCTEYWIGYTGGTFGCDQSRCTFDQTQCTRCDGTRCGDGVINGSEQCDGANLGTHSCADNNRMFGTISCLSNCNIDFSQCYGGCTIYKGKIISCN